MDEYLVYNKLLSSPTLLISEIQEILDANNDNLEDLRVLADKLLFIYG